MVDILLTMKENNVKMIKKKKKRRDDPLKYSEPQERFASGSIQILTNRKIESFHY